MIQKSWGFIQRDEIPLAILGKELNFATENRKEEKIKLLLTLLIHMIMKRLLILLFLTTLFVTANADGKQDYKEGDIVFQISKSQQSPLIQYATGSLWSHCGIIVMKNGEPYVLEASNVVKLTPLTSWVNKGRLTWHLQYRVFDKPIKINYQKYLGIPYDSQFSLNNKKYYCSELVWMIYKEQFGIELCSPKPLSSYNTFGLSKIMKKRGIKSTSLFVAPSDLLESKYLKEI